MSRPYLTQDEIDDICYPLKRSSSQISYMRKSLGLSVDVKPGGQPLVWRANLEAVKGPHFMNNAKEPQLKNALTEPNIEALQVRLVQKSRGKNHGPQA